MHTDNTDTYTAQVKQMNTDFKHKELTDKIIKAFYDVYNELGFGFLENVYQNAMYFELINNQLKVEAQKTIEVYYQKRLVGNYKADLVVNDVIILELKAVEHLVEEYELQLINYLKATNKEIGLLLNFGKKPEIRRKIFTNDRKKISVSKHTDDTDKTDKHRFTTERKICENLVQSVSSVCLFTGIILN